MLWNLRQRRMRLLLGAAMLACALALLAPSASARAAGWPLEDAGHVVLGFGESYRSAEATASSMHRGVDISAEAGARVKAPLAGTVTFAGSVPAVGGGRVKAVSISTPSGSLTLLPLDTLAVAKGAALAEGDAVGTLAADGDGSSAATHLHVGLKRGDLYVDPLSALVLPAAGPSSGGRGAGATACAGQSAGAGAAVAPGVTVPSHAAAGSAAGAGSAASAAAHVPASTAACPQLHPAVPGAVIAPGVSVAGVAPVATGAGAAAGASALAGVTARTAALPQPAAHAASSPTAASAQAAAFGELLARASRTATAGAQTLSLGGLGALGAVGLLWPLWRRETDGDARTGVLDNDVAAAVGQ